MSSLKKIGVFFTFFILFNWNVVKVCTVNIVKKNEFIIWTGTVVRLSVQSTIRKMLQEQTCRHKRCPLLWHFTERRAVIPYRRFGTAYRPHLQGSKSPGFDFLILEDVTGRLFRNVSTELLLCAISQKNKSLIYCGGSLKTGM